MSKSKLLGCGAICLILAGAVSQVGYRKTQMLESSIEVIRVSAKGSVVSFPAKPEKVILGSKDQFSIETVGRDLAIAPLSHNGTSNLFVYVLGRRFNFRLVTTHIRNDLVVEVFDSEKERSRH